MNITSIIIFFVVRGKEQLHLLRNRNGFSQSGTPMAMALPKNSGHSCFQARNATIE